MANLFKKPAVIPPPPVPAPVPLPDPNSTLAQEQAQKEAAVAASSAGRASTVLTRNAGPAANRGNSDTYGSTKLGSG